MVPIVVLLVVQVYNCLHVLGVSGKNKCPNNIPSGHGHRPTAWYVLGHCIVVGCRLCKGTIRGTVIGPRLGMFVSLDLVVVVDAKIAFGARPSAHGLLSRTTLADWWIA